MKWLLHFAFTTEAAPPPLGSWFYRAPYQRSNISNSKIQQCGFYAFPACEIRVPRRFCNCVAARFPPPAYPTTHGWKRLVNRFAMALLAFGKAQARAVNTNGVCLACCMYVDLPKDLGLLFNWERLQLIRDIYLWKCAFRPFGPMKPNGR